MIDPDAIHLLSAAVSPEEPAGTPPYPKDPEVQQQGLLDWFIYSAASATHGFVTRVETSVVALALGNFTRALLTGRSNKPFAAAQGRIERMGPNNPYSELIPADDGRAHTSAVSAIGAAHSIALNFLTYFNFDDIMEKKQGDPAAVAEMQRRGAMSAGGLS